MRAKNQAYQTNDSVLPLEKEKKNPLQNPILDDSISSSTAGLPAIKQMPPRDAAINTAQGRASYQHILQQLALLYSTLL